MKSGNLNFLQPSGPLQACNGTALPFFKNSNREEANQWSAYIYKDLQISKRLYGTPRRILKLKLENRPYLFKATDPSAYL